MTYLITGATGSIGRQLVRALIDGGHEVRVTTRFPETADFPDAVEVVAGDFRTGDIPSSAFNGVKAAFVFPALGGIEGFLAKAKNSGVGRLVLLSSLAAAEQHPRDRGSVSNLHHSSIEASVAATGIPTTVVRPGEMANNLLFWASTIKSTGTVFAPYADSAQAPIHEADIAAVALAALTEPGHAGKVYPLTGPQALTRRDQLAAIGDAIGRDLTFVEIEPDQFSEQMSAYLDPPTIKMLLDYWRDTVDQPDEVLPTVEDVTGRPGLSLARWATDHASAFQ